MYLIVGIDHCWFLTIINVMNKDEQAYIHPEEVFKELEAERESGVLSLKVSNSAVRYQTSNKHQGKLECIFSDGTILIGNFIDGRFIPVR